jgi:hypothetical protein
MEDGGMSGETAGFIPESIKEDLRHPYGAPGERLTPSLLIPLAEFHSEDEKIRVIS